MVWVAQTILSASSGSQDASPSEAKQGSYRIGIRASKGYAAQRKSAALHVERSACRFSVVKSKG